MKVPPSGFYAIGDVREWNDVVAAFGGIRAKGNFLRIKTWKARPFCRMRSVLRGGRLANDEDQNTGEDEVSRVINRMCAHADDKSTWKYPSSILGYRWGLHGDRGVMENDE